MTAARKYLPVTLLLAWLGIACFGVCCCVRQERSRRLAVRGEMEAFLHPGDHTVRVPSVLPNWSSRSRASCVVEHPARRERKVVQVEFSPDNPPVAGDVWRVRVEDGPEIGGPLLRLVERR